MSITLIERTSLFWIIINTALLVSAIGNAVDGRIFLAIFGISINTLGIVIHSHNYLKCDDLRKQKEIYRKWEQELFKNKLN